MNTLGNLNSYLFEQVERLNNADLSSDEFEKEIERGKAISGVAKDIISNANLVLQAQKFADDKWDNDKKMPKLLEG